MMKLPSFGKEIPKELFARIWTPVINSVLVLNFILKFYQFGSDVSSFSLSQGLIGVGMFAVLTVVIAYITILYIAFVPHLKLSYLTRLSDFSYVFHIRDHSFSEKWKGSIALWASDISEYLRILIPMMVLILGVTVHENLPKGYKVLLITALVMALLIYVFEGTVNLFKYGISLIVVIIIADSWNRIRVDEERTPQVMILWAEILLYAAMWAKGMTLIVG